VPFGIPAGLPDWPFFHWPLCLGLALSVNFTINIVQNGFASLYSTRCLSSISKEVASGVHAILTLDGAGYHAAAGLKTPDNITLLPLPSYSPELNPMENVWEYLRKNKLAITVYNDYDHIVDKSCEAWNFFAENRDAIASITCREWAQVKP
jgi:hypothetical protein